MAKKTIQDINEKIRKGEAVVYTARELKEMIRNGERVTTDTVDAVTTGTCGIMSGTAAILTVPVAEKGVFAKAESIWINGVAAHPGPCPNENLGIVDLILYGTSYASHEYGGGQIFRDLVAGKEVEVRVEANGNIFENHITLDDCSYAKLMTTRGAFKNYVSFLNDATGSCDTIFSVTGLRGPRKEIAISGCGEINPIENDPSLVSIGMGTRILVNGGVGYVIGQGTRSTPGKPNMSVIADLKGMQAQYMGGFKTSKTPEVITSIAVPIPVTEQTLPHLGVLDGDVSLPVGEIHDRVPFTAGTYADVWQGTDHVITYASELCTPCKVCTVERDCPTAAFTMKGGIDKRRCYNCGACVFMCPGGAFKGSLGSMDIEGTRVPITLRQSNRARADELCESLKERILAREFYLSEKVGSI
ncbi:MAG: methanogenesis marker 16 metalloprotein [Candidatus Methanofastidiosa archaeon]|nr:methanogenesis marker 16 metalloprotein [Candidatus Methanofastidiosa archaeon]